MGFDKKEINLQLSLILSVMLSLVHKVVFEVFIDVVLDVTDVKGVCKKIFFDQYLMLSPLYSAMGVYFRKTNSMNIENQTKLLLTQ